MEILPSAESKNPARPAKFPVRRTIPNPKGYAVDLAFFPDLCALNFAKPASVAVEAGSTLAVESGV
jgi:hypothetical protein